MCFLTQNSVFMNWFAQIAYEYAVGIPHRYTFSFGGDCDPAAVQHMLFYDCITRRICKGMYKLLIRCCGPKVLQGAAPPEFWCTQEQNKVFYDLQESMLAHKRSLDSEEYKAYCEGLPKNLYWLGTYT